MAVYFGLFQEMPTPAYPMRRDKPLVDTVWLEITNFCNQKCSFCPDMHREDKRSWLPLDRIKNLIDQLADTVEVASMQLNAYGEPLLHPQIGEIIAYINAKKLPFPTFFTTHGLTLGEKKLAQLSHNYPRGIAVSLHNDSQDSYARSRSPKAGDYDTMVARVSDLLGQMVNEGAVCHLRLYQLVCNGREDKRVSAEVRGAFASDAGRFEQHVRKWEAIARDIAAAAPPERHAQAVVNPSALIATCFADTRANGGQIPILSWRDAAGGVQSAFFSPRPVGPYANLLFDYDPAWRVERNLLNQRGCGFVKKPSLAIFASGQLGICCLDLNSTATFGALDDFANLREALESVAAKRMFAQLANGVAVGRGCQTCLSTARPLCGDAT